MPRCSTGTVTLTASGGTYTNYFWFDDNAGGNLIGTSANYTTPSLSSSRPYFVSDANISTETSLAAGASASLWCGTAGNSSAQLFNVANNKSSNIIITRLSVTTYGSSGSINAKVFYRSGSYVGSELSSSGWIQVFNGSVTRTGSPVVFNITDISIPPYQTYGFYVFLQTDPSKYITGANTYTNSDITISTGATECNISSEFNLGSGFLMAPRTFAGSVYYQTLSCESAREEVWALINSYSTPSVSITANPGNIICTTNNVTFTATPTNGGSTPTYQWRLSGSAISGATNSTYSSTTLANGDKITCVLTPSTDACPSPATATSNEITMSVQVPRDITSDPANTTLCQNGNTTLSVTADGGLYQWQVSTNSGTTWTNITAAGSAPVYGGWTTNILTLTGVDDPNNGYQYRCLAGCTPSEVATLTVNPVSDPVPVGAGACTPPAQITLSATGAGTGENYKWYSAATGATLVQDSGSNYITPLISATTTYYVTIIKSGCESYPRTPVVATIYTAPVVLTNPVNDTTNAGGTANFTVSATGVTLSYQWQVSTNGGTTWTNITTAGIDPVYSGWTTNTLHLSGIDLTNNNYQYRCVVSGICGFQTTSAVATLKVTNEFLHPVDGFVSGNTRGTCMVNTCEGKYYDDGGQAGDYASNINPAIFRTFCPNEPKHKMVATVNDMDIAWSTGVCNDVLYVFSGPNIKGTLLWEGCGTTGSTIYNVAGAYGGGVFQSTHISGCLTFWFSSGTSNPAGTWAGWDITLSCADFSAGPTGTQNTDCINAEKICNDYTASSTTYGPGIVSDGCNSCMGAEDYVEWYSVMMQTGGTIELEIGPNGVSDLDFAIYKASDCNNLGNPIRCSYATRIPNGKTGLKIGAGDNEEGSSGDQWVNEIHALAGEIYYVMISEWDKPNPNQYTLDWTLTDGASFSCNYVNGTLPVSLLSFDARCENNRINLEWVTSSEKNNNYFTIEKSIDAVSWRKLLDIPGNGNSNTLISYTAQDNAPYNGVSYYRLKQTDFDGKSEIFSPVSVVCDPGEDNPQINYYPNPFNSELIVDIQNMNTDKAVLVICDMMGKPVFYKTINNDDSFESKFVLNFQQFPSGVYIAKFTTAGYYDTQKIVKNY